MNGSLVSRTVVLLLVGVLGLAIGVGPANATLIDDFNTTNNPTQSAGSTTPSLWQQGTNYSSAYFAPPSPINVSWGETEAGLRQVGASATNVSMNYPVTVSVAAGQMSVNAGTTGH